jgi:methyl-accepting chemotaxis protein
VQLTVAGRAREVMRLIAARMPPGEVLKALPPTRAQLRARMVLFTAIAVVLPAVMAADVSNALAHRAYQKIAAAPATKQVEVAQQERADAIGSVLKLGALVFLLALATAAAGGNALGRPMREIADEANRIARGDLGEISVIPADDEVWAVASAFTQMQAHLSSVLGQLKAAGLRIGSTTEQIVATSQKYEAGAAEQATSLNETSATTEELARSARQIADNATSVSEIAARTLEAAQAGQTSAVEFSGSMGRMRHDNQAIADSVLKLNKRVQAIGRIVEFINGIADKSDLLALNAELEGTKAGEVGRAF